MSKKAVFIGIVLSLICIIAISAVYVVLDNQQQNSLITVDEAKEIGSQFLKETFLLPEADSYSAQLNGDAYLVFSIPGNEILNDNGVIRDYVGSSWYVYVSADGGEILTFGNVDELQ